MTMTAFVDAAWQDHADRPEEVADRLAGVLPQVQTAADILPVARLVTHVFGEHLARWNAGVDLLVSLRELPCGRGDPEIARAIERNIAGLRYAGGADAALAYLSAEDRIAALSIAGSALAGRQDFAERDRGVRGSPAACRARIAAGLPRTAGAGDRRQQSRREPRGKAGSRCDGNAAHGVRRGRRAEVLEAGGHLARARARGIPSRAELAAGRRRRAGGRRGAAMHRRVRRQRRPGLRALLRLGRARRCAASLRRWLRVRCVTPTCARTICHDCAGRPAMVRGRAKGARRLGHDRLPHSGRRGGELQDRTSQSGPAKG